MILSINIFLSSLQTLLVSLISGIIGYYLKQIIDQKKSKRVKILEINPSIASSCVKSYNPIGYLPPKIVLTLENLSKTDITIKDISLRKKKMLNIFPVHFINRKYISEIKQYEIKDFSFECEILHLLKDPTTGETVKHYYKPIETPEVFFRTLYWYLYETDTITQNWKNLEKKVNELVIRVHTNIGNYDRKMTKREMKYFKKALFIEHKKCLELQLEKQENLFL